MNGLRAIGTFPKIQQCGTAADWSGYGKRFLFDIFIYLHVNDSIPEVLAPYHNQPSLLLSDYEIGRPTFPFEVIIADRMCDEVCVA